MSITSARITAAGASRTTLAIPTDLLAQVDALVGEGRFLSRASAVDLALRRLLWDLEEAEMFEAFAEAAKDPQAVAEAVSLVEEASVSGWEAVCLGDGEDLAE